MAVINSCLKFFSIRRRADVKLDLVRLGNESAELHHGLSCVFTSFTFVIITSYLPEESS